MDSIVIATRVRELIIEQIGEDSAFDVQPDTVPWNDLGCDSLDAVELALSFEEEFHIDLSDDEVDTLMKQTVAEITTLVQAKIAAKTRVS